MSWEHNLITSQEWVWAAAYCFEGVFFISAAAASDGHRIQRRQAASESQYPHSPSVPADHRHSLTISIQSSFSPLAQTESPAGWTGWTTALHLLATRGETWPLPRPGGAGDPGHGWHVPDRGTAWCETLLHFTRFSFVVVFYDTDPLFVHVLQLKKKKKNHIHLLPKNPMHSESPDQNVLFVCECWWPWPRRRDHIIRMNLSLCQNMETKQTAIDEMIETKPVDWEYFLEARTQRLTWSDSCDQKAPKLTQEHTVSDWITPSVTCITSQHRQCWFNYVEISASTTTTEKKTVLFCPRASMTDRIIGSEFVLPENSITLFSPTLPHAALTVSRNKQ